ncbi:phenylacetate--CoA ligase family protein [Methylococcus sp. Mc7]|uniref:phenylacetate--CoA ligase family protein n=1 Tax=Methylococcus sp. Mc7 TaxID=2860258 RepID=UPI001C52ED87|nr:phenylacetate--CoA ligase family protein [Methylococcus sp. Mc7]QXP84055.1 phenylacetate--CoA ligase family protein [Methylococcus sp. Mc7]
MTVPLLADQPMRFLDRSLEDLMAERLACDPGAAALSLFLRAAAEVPAYRAFLATHGIRPDAVRTLADFARLPLTDKPSYMQAYPLPERCWGGRLAACDRVAVSSGSTGKPTFWPRALHHELDVALRFEQVFRDAFQAHARSTLAVVCFALGNWVGGIYTTSCLWHLARKGYPVTVATPGNRPDEIFRVIGELAPHFEQTVLLGYPPFVKDVIDSGAAAGISWERHAVKLVFAGEVFSEEWRSLVCARIGSDSPCYDTASLYGTADGGVLGNETPLSIAIRRFFAAHPEAARELFGESRLPTLVQYDPLSRYFELHDGTLVVTGDNGVPLIRYHIADRGGLVGYAEMREFLRDWDARDLSEYGFDPVWGERPLPFLFLFGRADFTVSYYGANIYPENVTVGLERPGIVDWVSGKFVLETPEDAAGDRELLLTVELLPGVEADEAKAARIAESVRTELLRLNSEFAHYTPEARQTPHVVLRPFAAPEYFPAGVKHRYTRR